MRKAFQHTVAHEGCTAPPSGLKQDTAAGDLPAAGASVFNPLMHTSRTHERQVSDI